MGIFKKWGWKKILFAVCVLYVVIFLLAHLAGFLNSQSSSAISENNSSNILSPNDSLTLITEPDDGIAPLLTLINGAKKSIDLVIYQLDDSQVEQALANAESRGVFVRVILNGGYYGKLESSVSSSAYSYFQAHNVPVKWSPNYFALTHQKTLVIDGDDAFIMTFNLVPKYYATSRDFGIDDKNSADVSAIEKTFDSDWQGEKMTAEKGNDLVWSPGSQDALISLINSATSTIEIYNEEMNDDSVTNALESAARRGVNVEVLMTYSSEWKKAFQELTSSDVSVRTYSVSAPIYIHAKMILIDGREAFVGSENFSYASLYDNRELGILIDDTNILSGLDKVFRADWKGATLYK